MHHITVNALPTLCIRSVPTPFNLESALVIVQNKVSTSTPSNIVGSIVLSSNTCRAMDIIRCGSTILIPLILYQWKQVTCFARFYSSLECICVHHDCSSLLIFILFIVQFVSGNPSPNSIGNFGSGTTIGILSNMF